MVGQTNCGNLSLTTIYPDSLTQGNYWIGIAFSGSANQFISYPHVSSVLNCQGDTLATGNLFYFAQMGQTSQDYPVGTGNAVWCEPLTIQFIYGDSLLVNDTCYFTYNSASALENTIAEVPSLYPNPTDGTLALKIPISYLGGSYVLLDALGKTVKQGQCTVLDLTLQLSGQSKGLYRLYFPEKAIQLGIVFR
jgi:hypothetical protein